MSGQFHLNISLLQPGQAPSAWRLPGRNPRAYLDFTTFRRNAQLAEQAKIHAVFLGDAPAFRGEGDTPPNGIDPVVLMSHLSAVTSKIGLLATSTTTYNDPYNLARRYLALDHVSGGRAAVNFVTTYAPDAAANFGLSEAPAKETRYRRADEFVELVKKLWSAWDDDAILGDKDSGIWFDKDQLRPVEHAGEFFQVRGPLSVPGSAQGYPVIFQAGGSEGGLRLAGKHAEAVFTVAQTQEKGVAFRQDILRRAQANGRNPEHVKVSLGVTVIVEETERLAREREQALYATIDIEKAAAAAVFGLGLDPAQVGPDDLIRYEDLPEQPGGLAPEGFQVSTRELLKKVALTPRDLVYRTSGRGGHRLVVGSPEQIADDLEDWFTAGTADGFTVMGADAHADLPNFLQLVVPILQRRGLFHTEYEGETLRDNYGLPNPLHARQAGSDVTAVAA